jgi:enterochelin esterase-like enzyme
MNNKSIPIVALYAVLFTTVFANSYGQKNQTFEDFLQALNKTDVTKRQALVDQYIKKIDKTPVTEGKDRVHFVWFGKADTVKIEGELQTSWAIPEVMTKVDCGANDLFYTSYTVPSNAMLQYLLIIDGQRSLDPKNPKTIPGFDFTDRNFFTMPDYVESLNLKNRSGINKGSVTQLLFKTTHAPFTDQPISIYMPPGYSKEKKYPVLYVYDGVSALYSRPYLNVVNNLIHDKMIEPIVVVFVNFEDRWREYVAESKEFAKLMAEEMVPFIEKSFGVANTSDKRAIMGASASGHAAIVAALLHPEVFGNVASQGGGAGGYPGLNPIANEALDGYLKKKDTTPLRTIYTEVGTFDLEFPQDKIVFSDGVDQFNKRLTENKIDYVFNKVVGGHNSTVWDQNLDKILVMFFGK